MSRKTHIIAEMAWGHDGKKAQALAIAKAAKDSGADSLSIHITSLPDYIVEYYGSGEGKISGGREDRKVYEYLEEINLGNEGWREVCEYARKLGLQLCIMANDLESFRFSEEFIKPEYYVIPPASMVEYDLLTEVAKSGRPTILRIGGSYLGEIEKAINIFREAGNDQIILLHGFQNYPTELKETDLALLPLLKQIFNVQVGLADHIDGSSDLAMVIPSLAVAFGAEYIEKHLTLNRRDKSEDFESALEPEALKKCIEYIEAAEIAIGSAGFRNLNDASKRYRNVVRKRIVFKDDFPAGHKLGRGDLCFKRCDTGLSLDLLDSVSGRTLSVGVEKDEAVTYEKLV